MAVIHPHDFSFPGPAPFGPVGFGITGHQGKHPSNHIFHTLIYRASFAVNKATTLWPTAPKLCVSILTPKLLPTKPWPGTERITALAYLPFIIAGLNLPTPKLQRRPNIISSNCSYPHPSHPRQRPELSALPLMVSKLLLKRSGVVNTTTKTAYLAAYRKNARVTVAGSALRSVGAYSPSPTPYHPRPRGQYHIVAPRP